MQKVVLCASRSIPAEDSRRHFAPLEPNAYMNVSAQRMVSVGAGAWQNARAFVGRGAKLSAPITAICGAIADLASTIGKFCVWLFVLSLVTAIVSGGLWFMGYRRKFIAAAADG